MSTNLVQTVLEKYENVIKENYEQRKTINMLVDLLHKSIEKMDNATRNYEKNIDNMKSYLAQIEIAQTQLLENQERIVNSKLAHIKKEIQKMKSSLHESKNQYDSVNENIVALKNTCVMRNTIADYPLLFDQKTIIQNLLQYTCRNYYNIHYWPEDNSFVLTNKGATLVVRDLELISKIFNFKLLPDGDCSMRCVANSIRYQPGETPYTIHGHFVIGFDAASLIEFFIPLLNTKERKSMMNQWMNDKGEIQGRDYQKPEIIKVCDYIKSTL